MDIKQVQPQLRQFAKAVSRKIKIDQVIIFGSYSEGRARADSDIDVIVVSKDFEKQKGLDKLKVLDEAARFIRPEIQAWGFTPRELEDADELTTLGHARVSGIRFSI